MPKDKPCLYCGGEVRNVRKGEHIIPDAIGGTKTLKCVCTTCNNETLSVLDKELVSKSHLSIVSFEELKKKVGLSWDIDHDLDNMLLEAEPGAGFATMRQWPQIVFCEDGPQLRGDEKEFSELGSDPYQRIFLKHLCKAFSEYQQGQRRHRLIFEQIRKIQAGASYPPRAYAERRVRSFNDRMHFKCRYRDGGGKSFLLEQLKLLKTTTRFSKYDTVLGSPKPGFALSFDAITVIRALTKIGVNLLAEYCTKTEVDRYGFRSTIRFITAGASYVEPRRLLSRCGFVRPDFLSVLKCSPGSHKFRLAYYKIPQRWYLYCAFFGGMCCAKVEFEGVCNEDWTTIDITVPIESSSWSVETSTDNLEIPLRVSWEGLDALLPHLPPPVRQETTFTIQRRSVRDYGKQRST